MKNLIAISLLLIHCSALQAVQFPDDFNARYSIEKYGTTVARMNLALSSKDNKYTYSSHSEAVGMLAFFSDDSIDEQSQLQWNDKFEHACLQSYSFSRKEKKQKDQQFSLNWSDLNSITITGTYAGKSFSLSTTDLIWDRLSVQLALTADLKSANAIQKKYSYNIIDKDHIAQYHFEYINEEIVHLGDRKYNTIKIRRPHLSNDRTTYLWLAKELDFLPVKIEQYRDDDLHMSMTLEKYTLKKK